MRPLPTRSFALAKTTAVKTAAVQTRSLGAPLPLRFKWAWHLVFTVVRYDSKLVLKSIIQRDLLSKSCRWQPHETSIVCRQHFKDSDYKDETKAGTCTVHEVKFR